ncbi:MAG: hypothetical protein LBL46_03405 [Rickettsiales bacterium]|jgi:hypothetical protein|nr:hypothetical protein [Rickettsiales bacterium]
MKTHILFIFSIFRLDPRPLYAWLLLEGRRRRGDASDPDDKEKNAAKKKRRRLKRKINKALKKGPLTKSALKKLMGDDYYDSVSADREKLEQEIGRSVIEIFDDDPVFAKYAKLRTLARDRDFEIKYYGRVR